MGQDGHTSDHTKSNEDDRNSTHDDRDDVEISTATTWRNITLDDSRHSDSNLVLIDVVVGSEWLV